MSGTIADWERDRFHQTTADEISALPEVEEPKALTAGPDVVREVLLERSYSGLKVEIVLLTADHGIAVRVTKGEEPFILQPIPGKDAFDAFHHPYCYLPA